MTDRLERMLALCRQHVPALRLVDKSDVAWMRAVAVPMRPFMPDFLTNVTTVLGDTVYLPGDPATLDRDELARTLAHELVHQLDQQALGVRFYAEYGLALPLWRTRRAHFERRAYAVDLLLARERGGPGAVQRTAHWLAEVFSGPMYGWMWGGRAAAARYLRPTVDDVLAGRLDTVEPYRAILAAWRG